MTTTFVPDALASLDLCIPSLPAAAWRLLIEMLKCDRGFCHAVVPAFHASGQVTLYLVRKPFHVLRGFRRAPTAIVGSPEDARASVRVRPRREAILAVQARLRT